MKVRWSTISRVCQALGPLLQTFRKSLIKNNHMIGCILLFPIFLYAEGLSEMELNLTSRWDNGNSKPGKISFNALCPVLLGTDERSRVGCTATAMAQIMYYWKWPTTGIGSGSIDFHYRWWDDWNEVDFDHNPFDPLNTGTPPVNQNGWPWQDRLRWRPIPKKQGGKLGVNGYWDDGHLRDDGVFKTQSLLGEASQIPRESLDSWQHLQDYQDTLQSLYDNPDHQAKAIYEADFGATTYQWEQMTDTWSTGGADAMMTLCYHAGVAAETEYGTKASGSDVEETCDALKEHFRYDTDMIIAGPPADLNAIREEIQWLRPVIMRGTKPGGGHYWVVYGYKTSTNQFKMNMGWGAGLCDGQPCYAAWYNLDGSDGLEYTVDQEHITRIAPTNVKFVGASSPGEGSPGNPYENIEESIKEAPDDVTLIFKAGSVNTFSGNELTINRPFILRGYDVIIRKE